ncbi:MAG TPA: pectinesterase family protein [Opitutaceae bacterium]|nr:pectinesterase family protein [Opitutaceae bacterium]
MKTSRAPRILRAVLAIGLGSLAVAILGADREPAPVKPDLVVAADGSGNFKTLHAAVQSIPKDNRERRIIFVKNGVYRERVRVDAPCVTIRGESRAGTRLEFSRPADDPVDELGRSVLELSATANDFVLGNFTVENTHGVVGVHAFTILGRADRVVIQDCDVLSHGNDTLSLWRGRVENAAEVAASVAVSSRPVLQDGGRYYHARLRVQGSVDFICPRGWCYLADSTITEMNPAATAAMWHDGRSDPDKKFVLRNCRFDGPPGWYLARHHHDAHFYFIDCTFSAAMRDQAPYRVIYPLNGGTPTPADTQRNQELNRTNVFGERSYYHGSHRTGGDYAWHKDNLAAAPGAPKPEQITAKWTFAGTWDPERTDAPRVAAVRVLPGAVEVEFSEDVTVKGSPSLVFVSGPDARYLSGSGGKTLVFSFAPNAHAREPVKLDLQGGAIIATEAGAVIRVANPKLPSP